MINKTKIFIAVVLSLMVSIWLLFFADYSDPRRSIWYRYGTELSLPYILGFLPKNYSVFCSESILEAGDKYKLILVDCRTYEITPDRYILLELGINKRETIFLFDNNKIGVNFGSNDNNLSHQLDILALNQYVSISGIQGRDEIKRRIFMFLHNINPKDFTIVETAEQLEYLKRIKGIEDNSIDYKLLVEDFEPDFEKYEYLWFGFYGLFEFNITIHDNILINLEDRHIYDTTYFTL